METSNHTVLITGGSSGIGLALARRFHQEGNRVVIVGRDKAKLAAAKAELLGVVTESADLRDPAALARLPEKYPDTNILVNNAGVQFNYDFVDKNKPLDWITTEINTNLTSPLLLTKLFLPSLLEKKIAAVVNVSSGLGFVPKQSAPVYSASKAAVHMFTKSLRWQLESTPVKVFEIVPPLVDTPMAQGRDLPMMAPDELVEAFWRAFIRDNYEVRIGIIKPLLVLNRLAPRLAERVLRGR